jgi:hypothetical protein
MPLQFRQPSDCEQLFLLHESVGSSEVMGATWRTANYMAVHVDFNDVDYEKVYAVNMLIIIAYYSVCGRKCPIQWLCA